MTLTEFLLARIDEDRRTAQAVEEAALGPSRIIHEGDPQEDRPWRLTGTKRGAEAMYVDYRRVLAECEAKRRIVGTHVEYWQTQDMDGDDLEPFCACCNDGKKYYDHGLWPCTTLRLIGLPYADHPDYRPEWAPAADSLTE